MPNFRRFVVELERRLAEYLAARCEAPCWKDAYELSPDDRAWLRKMDRAFVESA